VCSTASSWVGFRDSSNTDKKLYQQGALDPAPKPVYEHLHLSPTLLHGRAFHRGPEPPSSQSLEKRRRGWSAGVCEERLSTRREQSRDQAREGRGVPSLVEHVGGEDQVECPKATEPWREPVEERGLRFPAQVGAGIVGYEVEGGLVVVGREDFRAAVQRHDGWKPHAAPELDGVIAAQVLAREIARQGDCAGPELCPVREPLLMLEVFLVEQIIDGGRVHYLVGPAAHFDGGFGQACSAAQVCSQPVQG
jgi:hypothetical protein